MGKVNVLVVSDLHHGSLWGLMPPDFETNDGRMVGLNVGQEYLWKCWLDLCDTVADMDIHCLVFNGDCIDGKQRKNNGAELNLAKMSEQARAAKTSARLLQQACKNPPTYVIKGTPYHSGDAGDDEQRFAAALNAGKALEYLDLDIQGVVIDFLHGVGGSGGFYRATGPDKEALLSALAGKEGKAPKADCLVRSHVHYFVHVEHPTKHIVVTPCWQLQTSHALKGSRYKFIPDIGAVLIEVDPEEKRKGNDPITVRKIIYTLPAQKAIKLKVTL